MKEEPSDCALRHGRQDHLLELRFSVRKTQFRLHRIRNITHRASRTGRLTPNGGKTYLVKPFFLWIASRASMSDESSLMSLRFSSIREGVIDFASTELPRATDMRQLSCSNWIQMALTVIAQ